jgi:hypothetical protein
MNLYWYGGSGNWSDYINHWSLSSGNSPVNPTSAIPTFEDDVFIDENSGFDSGGTITTDIYGIECHNFTSTSGHNYTIIYDGAGDLNIYGSAIFESGTTFDPITGAYTVFRSTEPWATININGATIFHVEFDGVDGSWVLEDDLHVIDEFSGINGTFFANNRNITASRFHFTASLGLHPVIVMGSGIWEATGEDSNEWFIDQYDDQIVTIIPGTSTIKMNLTGQYNQSFYFDDDTGFETGKTYYDIWLTGNGTGHHNIYGSNTFHTFRIDTPPRKVLFQEGKTTIVLGWRVSGTPGNLITLNTIEMGG